MASYWLTWVPGDQLIKHWCDTPFLPLIETVLTGCSEPAGLEKSKQWNRCPSKMEDGIRWKQNKPRLFSQSLMNYSLKMFPQYIVNFFLTTVSFFLNQVAQGGKETPLRPKLRKWCMLGIHQLNTCSGASWYSPGTVCATAGRGGNLIASRAHKQFSMRLHFLRRCACVPMLLLNKLPNLAVRAKCCVDPLQALATALGSEGAIRSIPVSAKGVQTTAPSP